MDSSVALYVCEGYLRRWPVVFCILTAGQYAVCERATTPQCFVLSVNVGAHSGCSPGSQDVHTFSFRGGGGLVLKE